MFNIGTGELLILLLIVLVIFGANRLPQLGSALGKGIQNFRKAMKGEDTEENDHPSTKSETPERRPGA